jgi:hypothetical protein
MSAGGIITAVIAALAVGFAAIPGRAGYRRHRLRTMFGPEYDRVEREHENTRAADRELARRKREHDQLDLHPIGPGDQNSYALDWKQLKERFTDDPEGAVEEAERLVTQVFAAKGYPEGDHGEQLAMLSVEHARALTGFREAQLIKRRAHTGEATTEDLRRALTQYHVLFGELLVTPGATRVR